MCALLRSVGDITHESRRLDEFATNVTVHAAPARDGAL
jgi:hypothetical protein